ncbi:MAG: transposase [Armatimonadetes bacterium]|nr:transposase [Armatimonadota bacterium]
MNWPHAPSKIVCGPGLYIITAGTYQKHHHFSSDDRLRVLQQSLFSVALEVGWELQAWALFSNHYHLVGICNQEDGVRRLTSKLHGATGQYLNKLEGTPGRKVWYRCRDTLLTNEKSYMARLAYVHNNSMKHLKVPPEQYEFCSMHWFKTKADRPFYETVMSFPTDSISIDDDY